MDQHTIKSPTAQNLPWYTCISTHTSLAPRANGPHNFWNTLYVSVHKSDHQKYVNHWMKSWQKNWKPPCHHSRFLEFFAVCVQSFWGPWSHVRRPSRLSTLRWLLRHLLLSSSLYLQHVHWTRTTYKYSVDISVGWKLEQRFLFSKLCHSVKVQHITETIYAIWWNSCYVFLL